MTLRPGLWRVAMAALATVIVALPARGALFDDDEARKRIEATNQRLTQVQRQLEDRIAALETQLKSQGLVELFSQVEQLKSDLARLRGQIEVLTYEQDQQQKRQRDLYVDLDSRLRKLEGGPGAGGPAAEAGPAGASGAVAGAGSVGPAGAAPVNSGSSNLAAGPPPSAAEQRAYDAALDQFKAGRYAPAIASFGAFVKTYPKSSLAPSAQYWIGNAQFAQRDFRAAMASQRQLIAMYPDSPKVPDALLNVATSQFELGDAQASRRTLDELIARYPQTDAAAKARARLGNR